MQQKKGEKKEKEKKLEQLKLDLELPRYKDALQGYRYMCRKRKVEQQIQK